jgi:Domain of unknown function (DUF6438)
MKYLHASHRIWLATLVVALAVVCLGTVSTLKEDTPATAVESITLKRFGHAPQAPTYEVTLHRDGSVTYVGSYNVARLGKHQTKDHAEEFRRLAELVERSRFFSLSDNYPAAPDAPAIRISVKAGGKTKTVEDGWGSRAPVELWGLEMAIDGVVASINGWQKVD